MGSLHMSANCDKSLCTVCVCVCVFVPYSDDRSLEVFRNKIEAATSMKSVLAKDGRPNCLIIDEIDGAPTV